MPAHLKLLRVHQWVKNLFTVAPVFLAGILFSHPTSQIILSVLFVFLAFCFASSTVYILNDIVDVKADKAHPKKKHRPIASGAIDIKEGYALMAFCFVVSIGLALLASKMVVVFVICYMLLNVAYSYKIKKIPIMDGVSISLGFTLRLLAGGPAIAIAIHPLVICSAFFAAFTMALVKRRIELVSLGQGTSTRASLQKMTPQLLDTLIAAFLATSLALYCSWCATNPKILLLFSLIPLAATVARFLWLAYQNNDGEDFSKTILNDYPMLGSALTWVLVAGFALAN